MVPCKWPFPCPRQSPLVNCRLLCFAGPRFFVLFVRFFHPLDFSLSASVESLSTDGTYSRTVDVTRRCGQIDFQLNAPESQEVLFCPVAGSKCPSHRWSNLCRIKSAHLSRHSSVTRTRHTFNFEHPFAVPVVEDSHRSIPRIGLTVLAACNKVSIYLSIRSSIVARGRVYNFSVGRAKLFHDDDRA